MEDLTHLRKRLLYQSQRQGTREMDLLMGQFAAQHLLSMTLSELKEFEALIRDHDSGGGYPKITP